MKTALVAFSKIAASSIGAAVALFALLMLGGGASSMGTGAIGGGGGGGLTQAIADTLYCKLTGCAMTGALSVAPSAAGTTPLSVRTNNSGGGANDTLVSIGASGNEWLGVYSSGATGGQRINLSAPLKIAGVATDVTTGTNEDLTVLPNGTGIIDLAAGNGSTTGTKIHTGADGAGMLAIAGGTGTGALVAESNHGMFRAGADGGLGSTTDETATTLVAHIGDNMSPGAGGNLLFGCYGAGLETTNVVQTATCTAGTVSIDPQSTVVIVDAAAASCTATIATTSMGTIAQEGLPIRISAKNVGASTVKFATTNFATAPPAKCTTTGLALGQSALIAWDKDQTKWTFLGGCE